MGGPKILAALAALLLTLGLAACGGNGGGGGSSAASSAAESAGGQAEGGSGKSGSKNRESKSAARAARAREAAKFAPKQHNDSGGGSDQYVQKGGDNSVQEFGAEADTSELAAAAAALHNFLDARAERNWAAACNYMAKSVIESFEELAARAKQIEDQSCAGVLEKLTNPAAKGSIRAEAEKADVGSLRIEGGRAFVIYRGLDKTIIAMPMTREDGDWKVASLAGAPLN
jgi:hypothetical protein